MDFSKILKPQLIDELAVGARAVLQDAVSALRPAAKESSTANTGVSRALAEASESGRLSQTAAVEHAPVNVTVSRLLPEVQEGGNAPRFGSSVGRVDDTASGASPSLGYVPRDTELALLRGNPMGTIPGSLRDSSVIEVSDIMRMRNEVAANFRTGLAETAPRSKGDLTDAAITTRSAHDLRNSSAVLPAADQPLATRIDGLALGSRRVAPTERVERWPGEIPEWEPRRAGRRLSDASQSGGSETVARKELFRDFSARGDFDDFALFDSTGVGKWNKSFDAAGGPSPFRFDVVDVDFKDVLNASRAKDSYWRAQLNALSQMLGGAFDDAVGLFKKKEFTGPPDVMPDSLMPKLASADVHTYDPLRTLLRVDGYGGNPSSAVSMERIVAGTRNDVLSGKLTTHADVERRIASQYLDHVHGQVYAPIDPAFKGSSVIPNLAARMYSQAGLLEKHEQWKPLLRRVVGPEGEHQATATIDGQTHNFVKTEHDFLVGYSWKLPTSADAAAFSAAARRQDNLFEQLLKSREAGESPIALNQNLERVAEMEWLNAQTWKYVRGSAGVSQLEARTWLEIAGIDSGRFKAHIDPNIEALTRSLDNYKRAYPTFFQNPPNYFSVAKSDRMRMLQQQEDVLPSDFGRPLQQPVSEPAAQAKAA